MSDSGEPKPPVPRCFQSQNSKVTSKLMKFTITTTTEPCAIISWTETQIVIECDATCGTIEVYSVYGTASFDVACNDRPVKKPEKRHKK